MLKTLLPKPVAPVSLARHYKEFEGHEFVIRVSDESSGLLAYIAIHTTAPGPAHGGTRLRVYDNEKDAFKDVLNLSKAMSYKSALAGLPYGGAKGVIVLGREEVNRNQLLRAYAKKVDQLNGLFRTGTDVGLTDKDIAFMSRHSKFMLGLPKTTNGRYSTSESAAKGVYYSILAASKYRYGSSSLRNKTVGVKGLGKLGGELVGMLHRAGARILISDIDGSRVSLLKTRYPDVTAVNPEEIHKQKMDVYAPCALGGEFKLSVIKDLDCEIIAGGANNQLPSDKSGDELFKRNIIYVPDYVANAGGLIFVSEDLEKDGYHLERMEKRLKGIKRTVTMVLERSEETGIPPHRVADEIARERIGKKRNG